MSDNATGRLLKYNNEVGVLVDDLAFHNGLLTSEDESYLCPHRDHNRQDPQVLAQDTQARPQPSRNLYNYQGLEQHQGPKGGFWIGLHGKRGKFTKWYTSYPWLRRLVMKLPPWHVQRIMAFMSNFRRHVIALRISEEGKIVKEIIVHGAAREMFESLAKWRRGMGASGCNALPFNKGRTYVCVQCYSLDH
jgi:hypothetical protein